MDIWVLESKGGTQVKTRVATVSQYNSHSMNISSIALSSAKQPVELKTTAQKVQDDFKSLGSAIQAGNLSAAKVAFASLQKDLPKPVSSAGSDNKANDPMSALATALKTGDLSAASQALTKLQQPSQGPSQSPAPGGAVAPSSAQALAASANQEAQETTAQTKAEAAKGDGQAVRKLAQIAAKQQAPAAAQIVPPDGTGRILRAVS